MPHRLLPITAWFGLGVYLLALLGPTSSARAQVCPGGPDFLLETQTDVDNFPQGCTEVTGVLSITGTITDLGPLNAVRSVRGNLEISGLPGLQSVDGLSSLESAGALLVRVTFALTSLSLPRLSSVDTDVVVMDNQAPISVDLAALSATGGNVALEDNDALVGVHLPTLEAIGGIVRIRRNGALTDLALPALSSVRHGIDVERHPDLVSLDLSALTSVGAVTIRDNVNLSDCCGLLPALDRGIVIRILDNADGCNSEEGIRAICPASVPTLPSWAFGLLLLLLLSGACSSLVRPRTRN